MIGGTQNNNSRLNAVVVVPLKYLGNLWRSLGLPLVICEIQLDLTWSKYCVISEIPRSPDVGEANPGDPILTTSATF